KDILKSGDGLTVSAWDILSGDVRPGRDVLIYDEAGDHVALQAADVLAASGAKVEIMTRDRSFSPEVMAMNLVPYMRSLQEKDVTFTVTWLLKEARKSGNRLVATLGTDYSKFTKDKDYDQIVVNCGTLPNADLYFDLKEQSVNRGELDHGAFINGRPQAVRSNADGGFQLFRIGDAVSARNTHAAIYDALRLMKDI
ncbi:MAG: N-methylproline demethylase, partial [Rhodobacteraceae bacterium]|nr:N-methylproline demethylase [Paracoccaceae bacterium]